MTNNNFSEKPRYLGDFSPIFPQLLNEDLLFAAFREAPFKQLATKDKLEKICRLLCEAIAKTEGFLLPAVIKFITRLNDEKITEGFAFNQFELWLNQFSGMNFEENLDLRSKIVGKKVPREDYQVLFPIGMGKLHSGSHYVTAHSSPDLDTTVASFWGWVDAFGARVSEGLHFWNVPGGPLEEQIEIKVLFENMFGKGVYQHLVKVRSSLTVASCDIVSQKGVVKKCTNGSSWSLDLEKNQNAVVLVDELGFYKGDWRSVDVEVVRQVIMLVNQCLRWFESNLHQKLISLFSHDNFCATDLPIFVDRVLNFKIHDTEPAKEFSDKQRKNVHDYLTKVLGVKLGIDGTFGDFALSLKKLGVDSFQVFIELLTTLERCEIFDKKGSLIEDRKSLFNVLEKVIKSLDRAIHSIRVYVDSLEVALRIKTEVFAYQPLHVSYKADVEEMRSKMGNNPYLTVTMHDLEGRLVPLGVIHASDLYRPVLGTVTLRDFCNREETKVPSYLEIISIIDHHKGQLQALAAPTISIADVQSSNVIVASLAFGINDRYSTQGMSAESIHEQVQEILKDYSSASSKRILRRLLCKQEALGRRGSFYVHPDREFVEYFHFIYAILEDTDLLTKVSKKDIECVAELLNRMKSLLLKKEVEVVHFDDLSEGPEFVISAARRLLRNSDLYSLYRKIYLFKEEILEQNLVFCADGRSLSIFADTKEQNGCCRIGQTKLFPNNFPCFSEYADAIRLTWLTEAYNYHKEKNEVDLHLHMISSIEGVETLYSGNKEGFKHQDELWFCVPSLCDSGLEHLKTFLNNIRTAPHVVNNDLELVFLGQKAKVLQELFTESFIAIDTEKVLINEDSPLNMVILRYKAGTMNSRKAMIAPYLPKQAN